MVVFPNYFSVAVEQLPDSVTSSASYIVVEAMFLFSYRGSQVGIYVFEHIGTSGTPGNSSVEVVSNQLTEAHTGTAH